MPDSFRILVMSNPHQNPELSSSPDSRRSSLSEQSDQEKFANLVTGKFPTRDAQQVMKDIDASRERSRYLREKAYQKMDDFSHIMT
uniref:TORC_N domain-containing protein n=1 Tax=Steinernema glaseri TaxID=37863 RepID=A0A1I7ZYT1_9BILA